MTDLATLHKDVVFGRSGGRIIWQPRIGCWYSDKTFAGEPLPEPYRGKTIPEIYRLLGCSARLYEFNSCFRRIEDPRVERTHTPLNNRDTEVTWNTPVGKQVAINRRSSNNPGTIHVKWEIESEEELKVAIWREEHTTWEWDPLRYEQLLAELGDLGAPTMYMPRMNVQNLYIEKMGVEKGIYALFDGPDVVEAYFRALHASHERLMDVIVASPVEIINFGENIHSATLSPELFEHYHLPECQHRCERLHQAGKFVHSHWDGDCGPLLRYARKSGLDGIEAITPRPQGDVTLEQVREALGDDMFLLDGIPAVYFDKTFPVETLVECTEKIIELFAPRLVLGISDEISSTGDIERVRIVGDIVKQYNRHINKTFSPNDSYKARRAARPMCDGIGPRSAAVKGTMDDHKKSFHVFLLAGQSNMAGRGTVEEEDRVPHPRVLALSSHGDWVPAVDPIHFDKRAAGVGLGRTFGLTLAEKDERVTIGLVPCATGGSPISVWQPGLHWAQTDSFPYDDTITRARRAMENGVLRGILWHQGEGDCNPTLANDYETHLRDLIHRLRRDLGVPDIPFVIGQLGQFPENPWSASTRRVNTAHTAIVKNVKATGFVSSDGLTSLADNVHFDAPSLREFGRRYAGVYAQVAEQANGHTGP